MLHSVARRIQCDEFSARRVMQRTQQWRQKLIHFIFLVWDEIDYQMRPLGKGREFDEPIFKSSNAPGGRLPEDVEVSN